MSSLPCDICPMAPETYPDDRRSQAAFRLIELAHGGLSREQPPPWDWICAAAGIRDVEMFREVWHRVGRVRALYEEAERLRHPPKS